MDDDRPNQKNRAENSALGHSCLLYGTLLVGLVDWIGRKASWPFGRYPVA